MHARSVSMMTVTRALLCSLAAVPMSAQGVDRLVAIVNDLKLEPREGGVALWVGPATEGYFSNPTITAR